MCSRVMRNCSALVEPSALKVLSSLHYFFHVENAVDKQVQSVYTVCFLLYFHYQDLVSLTFCIMLLPVLAVQEFKLPLLCLMKPPDTQYIPKM